MLMYIKFFHNYGCIYGCDKETGAEGPDNLQEKMN